MFSRKSAVFVALLIATSALVACQPAVAGARCRTTEMGEDATHVLKCVGGRWVRQTTKEQVARALIAIAQARRAATSTTAPPVMTVPTTATPTTTAAPAPPYVSAMATNYRNACALISNGTVKCWGDNSSGQATGGVITVGVVGPTTVAGITGATKVAIGYDHGCALVAGGAIKCWGANNHGQLGDGTIFTRTSPVTVVDDLNHPLAGYTLLAAGASHTCAADGPVGSNVRCWGLNNLGQAGTARTTDELSAKSVEFAIPYSYHTSAITSFYNHTCILTGFGGWCWGNNAQGQLGANVSTAYETQPNNVSGPSGSATPLAIAVGDYHTCLINNLGGTVSCFGSGGSGQGAHGSDLADYNHWGTETTVLAASAFALNGQTAITAGSAHTCAEGIGGVVTCWGFGDRGQMGDGGVSLTPPNPSYANRTPGGASAFSTVSAGGRFTCFLTPDHVVRCSGNDSQGELGRGTTTATARDTPLVVNVLP